MAMASSIDRLLYGIPVWLRWLLGINIAVAVIIGLGGLWAVIAQQTPADTSWLYLPPSFSGLAEKPWTLFTYMFTHVNFWHLFFNMIWLWWFGMLLESCGPKLTLALYLGGGIAGALLFITVSSATGDSSGAGLCGASASILAMMGATAVLMPRREVRFLFGWTRLLWLTIAAIALTFLGSLMPGTASFPAHLGGFLFGLATASVYKFKYYGHSCVNTHREARIAEQPQPQQTAGSLWSSPEALTREQKQTVSDPEEQLDLLLDKIRISGYDSLSSKEKTKLHVLSQQLKEKTQR